MLLFNVVKHAGVDRAHLELRESPSQLLITVADEGCGFDVKHIFEKPAKSGFGLPSVQKRLELFGGRIVAESSAERGTRMSLIVPKRSSENGGLSAIGKG